MSELSLRDRVLAAGPRIAESALAEMYEDPFWRERFGDRGRHHAGRDGDYHIQYLVEAISANEPQIFVKYARWLREVLVTRGMCSRHLAENFERIAHGIGQEAWPDRERAVAILEAGARALAYEEGDAAAIDRARETAAEELHHLLSYLADAMALHRPELFAQHVAFLGGYCRRHSIPLREHLVALSRIAKQVSTAAARCVEEAANGLAR
jgi:hypothetical protein